MGDLEARIDRLESIEAINDITARYPILLDARDLDGLVQLFVEDVKASPTAERGRGPLRAHYERLCRGWGYTVHQLFAATSVWAAVSPELDGQGGVYLEDCQVAEITDADVSYGVRSFAVDAERAGALWDLSERLVASV